MGNEVIARITARNMDFADTRCMSVSKCIGYLSKPFDKEGVAKTCSERDFDKEGSKYYGMTPEAIIAMWDEKSDESKRYGSLLDEYVELRLENKDAAALESWKLDNNYEYDERLRNNCKGFDDFIDVLARSTDYEYVGRETALYIVSASGNALNGRFDCLFRSRSTGNYLLIDWKTTEDIDTSNRFQKMLGPMYALDKCKMNEYTTQLHMYKKALVETYGVTDYQHIQCFVCQTVQAPNARGLNYNIIGENFQFNPKLLDKVIDFATQKHRLERLSAASK